MRDHLTEIEAAACRRRGVREGTGEGGVSKGGSAERQSVSDRQEERRES